MHSRLLTIRSRLFLIILLAALPAIALFIVESVRAYRQSYDQAGKNLLEMAELAANNHSHAIRGVHDLLKAISETPFITDRNADACNSYLSKINQRYRYYHTFSIIDANGEMICTGNPARLPINIEDRPYFDVVMTEKRFVVAGYLVNRVTNTPVVSFAIPIFGHGPDNQAVIGLATTALRLETFSRLAQELVVPPGATVTIVDAQGVVLATRPGQPQQIGKPLAHPVIRAGLSTPKAYLLEAADANGVKRLFAIAPAMYEGRASFHAIIGLDQASLLAPAIQSLSINLAALFSLVLLSLAGTWIISKKLLVRPVNQLIATAEQVREGNLHVHTHLDYRAGEMGQLAQHFDDMTTALAQRENEMRANNRYIEYLAHHDELTKLPNRRFLHIRLAELIGVARKTSHQLAVLFIDIDRFRVINDSLGHATGDLLLVSLGERLQAFLEPTDFVARFGGDEFVCILTRVQDRNQVLHMATDICHHLSEPYLLADERITLDASFGISMSPHDCSDGPTAIKYAEIAMRQAKMANNQIEFFSEELNTSAVRRLRLENELREALVKEQFMLYYQPQINLHSGRIIGAESLIRWQHPEKGVLSPSSFIALAEETRLILEIGEWVLNTACRQGRLWQDAGLPPIQLAVNVSAYQFRQPGFPDTVATALQQSGLPAHLLELEVTESVLLDNVANNLAQLRSMGIALSIDDFGTGYSSLSYLKDLPVDKLKIDQSFIRHLAVTPNNQAITRAIVSLAKSLDLKVIAEGVDTIETLELLRSYECDEIQGYYHSRPMPPEEFVRMLRSSA